MDGVIWEANKDHVASLSASSPPTSLDVISFASSADCVHYDQDDNHKHQAANKQCNTIDEIITIEMN